MEPVQTETVEQSSCPHCQKAAEESAKNEETSFAFLLALLPVITLTFFGQTGLL